MNDSPTTDELTDKLHAETAQICWHELQRFFAQGSVLAVADGLDLIGIAVMLARDDVDELAPLVNSGSLVAPSNDLARRWFDDNTELWSLVVAPFVLVQENR